MRLREFGSKVQLILLIIRFPEQTTLFTTKKQLPGRTAV